ncbi:MAG: TIGR02757 family protein [Vicinamibacteraceae bacterium]|nr:TIGR02757 family protein [Vicinamibacteraceae bacterium]
MSGIRHPASGVRPASGDAALSRFRAAKPALDALYDGYNRADADADPIEYVHHYTRADDREVMGFLAAGLAFGRVASIRASLARVERALGPHPAETVRRFDLARDAARFDGFVHRWVRGPAMAALIAALGRMLREGTLEDVFLAGDPGGDTIEGALEAFSLRGCAEVDAAAPRLVPADRRAVGYFFPRPSRGSACKRINLFLRWMVRRDRLDPGVWTRVSPSRLIVPLDTHVVRVGRCLQLTRRVTPGWAMACDITAALRRLDAGDPVRYDFALCRLGMKNLCGFNREQGSDRCPLAGACRPRPGRPPRSRRPSAPR